MYFIAYGHSIKLFLLKFLFQIFDFNESGSLDFFFFFLNGQPKPYDCIDYLYIFFLVQKLKYFCLNNLILRIVQYNFIW